MKDYEALSKKHFDGQAAEYDQRDTYYYSQNGKISCRDIAEQIRAIPYESLLDVGCGTGFLIDLLTRQKAVRYFGLDLSDEMIRVAQEKAIPGASFTVGSADRLPYPDESFDIVTCSQSFHHYPYPEQAILEAKRVLKPGGLYILSDTGISGLGAWIDNHILFKLPHHQPPGHRKADGRRRLHHHRLPADQGHDLHGDREKVNQERNQYH